MIKYTTTIDFNDLFIQWFCKESRLYFYVFLLVLLFSCNDATSAVKRVFSCFSQQLEGWQTAVKPLTQL